ncbi:response regulator transcription factor [Streptococcus halichoeri]|uniref:response regulator transcription factor n=1 Tax=Streptococcus halichoeri TaxID=254785 RepID=UPI00135B27A5|nr:response regulator transcription factor [Streptococcus halichoeri]
MFTILVAEDDQSLNTIISTKLRQEHYQVYSAFNGQQVLDMMETESIDLLITDIMMPIKDGYALVQDLRGANDQLPILMITAKSQLQALEQAFKLGVDDYLVKPVRLSELSLRVKALLRRAQLEAEQHLQVGQTRLDYNQLTLTNLATKQLLQLPPKEFYVLYKLLSHPEKIFTRLDLLDDIWGMDDERDERLVDACIKRLRKKCQGMRDFQIITIRGLGYKGRISND